VRRMHPWTRTIADRRILCLDKGTLTDFGQAGPRVYPRMPASYSELLA
jgi:hypothetical protein